MKNRLRICVLSMALAFGCLFFILSTVHAQSVYQPQTGDILFQDLDCGDFCDAVEAVTKGVQGYDFSHMAIIGGKTKTGFFVYEARSKGVVRSDYQEFITRSVDVNQHPKIVVGRLKDKWQPSIPKALQWMATKLGKAYDVGFDLNNDKYYCSEMIHLAFRAANAGQDVFRAEPMTFKDPQTKQIFTVWQNYFNELKLDIPEGELGLNPGGMSRSRNLKIIFNMMQP